MISQIFTQDCYKILSFFSLSPGSRFNRKEIKNRILLNNVPLDAALSRLLSSGILIKERNYYSINLEDDYSKKMIDICKKQYKKLREPPLNVFYMLIDLISGISVHKGTEISLFGSYAKLVYSEKSDVDLAVLTTLKTDKGFIRKIAAKLEKTYEKNIELHFFDKRSFLKNKKDPLVEEIIRNGVKII